MPAICLCINLLINTFEGKSALIYVLVRVRSDLYYEKFQLLLSKKLSAMMKIFYTHMSNMVATSWLHSCNEPLRCGPCKLRDSILN